MSDDTFLVTLPNGKDRGPFSTEVLTDLMESGGLPEDATIAVNGSSRPLGEALREMNARGKKRISAAQRKVLGGTRAETPQAMSALALNKG